MGRFRSNSSSSGIPKISTASLPDIVFMLLFFFMIATTMKEVDFKVSIKAPEATELTALKKKDARFIYVGVPNSDALRAQYGSEPRIQLDDAFADVAQIENYVTSQRAAMPEEDQNKMTISLKVDKDCKMGIVTDIKQALRRAQALKINYAAIEKAK
jgi:biopolymer transport protein ExbD